jgi:hypothetical protein
MKPAIAHMAVPCFFSFLSVCAQIQSLSPHASTICGGIFHSDIVDVRANFSDIITHTSEDAQPLD